MTQEQWQQAMTLNVAAAVRLYRRQRGLSAQQMADECARLGFPIARSVLANLENGRREAVSVAELAVLAAALHVPPVQLLYPLGLQRRVEVLPGISADPWDAVMWFSGSGADPADWRARPEEIAETPVNLWGLHENASGMWEAGQRWLTGEWAKVAQAPEADRPRQAERLRAEEARIEVSMREVRGIRAALSRQGYLLPEVSAELAAALGEPKDPDAAPDGAAAKDGES